MTPEREVRRRMHGWFGIPWNGCLNDDGTVNEDMRIPVPVGEPCAWCEDPIVAADSGQSVPLLCAPDPDGKKPPAVIMYQHRECLLRSVVGGLDHLAGRCICCVPGGSPDELGSLSAGMTLHEEALAVDEHVARHGI